MSSSTCRSSQNPKYGSRVGSYETSPSSFASIWLVRYADEAVTTVTRPSEPVAMSVQTSACVPRRTSGEASCSSIWTMARLTVVSMTMPSSLCSNSIVSRLGLDAWLTVMVVSGAAVRRRRASDSALPRPMSSSV
jgi:hypothetical protein